MEIKKYGVVDIGSNTIRFNIYRDNGKKFKVISSKKTFAGLSSYVENEVLQLAGIKKIIKNLKKFKDISEELNVDEMYIFATASIRNVKNSKEVIEQIESETGILIDLVCGEKEGYCGFLGVKQEKDVQNGYVLDIGGGSTEIISFENGKYQSSISMPLGSLSTYKKFVRNIIPKSDEELNIRNYIKQMLLEYDSDIYKIKNATLYGIGGTIRATGNIAQEYLQLNDNKTSTTLTINQLISDMIEKNQALIHSTLKVSPERIHTQVPGMIILVECMKYLCMDKIQICKNGVREGYLFLEKGEI